MSSFLCTSFGAGFMVFTLWTSHFQKEFKFYNVFDIFLFFGKVLAHTTTSTRKAFQTIAKLKLGKYMVGCSRPIIMIASFCCLHL